MTILLREGKFRITYVAAGVLVLTWVFFGYDIWLHSEHPINTPIIPSNTQSKSATAAKLPIAQQSLPNDAAKITSLENQLAEAQQKLVTANKTHSPASPSTALQAHITSLQSQLGDAQKTIAELTGTQFVPTEPLNKLAFEWSVGLSGDFEDTSVQASD